MTIRLPHTPSTAHLLSPELRARIRRAALKQTEPRQSSHGIWNDEAYTRYCDTHWSNGMCKPSCPDYVLTWRTGFTTCAFCDEETDGTDMCPRCENAYDPHHDEPRRREHRASFDPGEP